MTDAQPPVAPADHLEPRADWTTLQRLQADIADVRRLARSPDTVIDYLAATAESLCIELVMARQRLARAMEGRPL